MTRDELIEGVSRAILANSRPNADPDALTPGPRGTVDLVPKWVLAQHLAVAAIDHPRISRALTLLDRIGDEAADALIAGTAAVLPVQCDFDVALKAAEADALHQAKHGEQIDMQTLYGLFLRGRLDRGGA